MNTPRQVSRLWVSRYARPRTLDGRFAKGFVLWTRSDGQSRMIYWPGPFDPLPSLWERLSALLFG